MELAWHKHYWVQDGQPLQGPSRRVHQDPTSQGVIWSMITIILLVCLQIGDTPRKMMMTMGCMMLSFDAWCHIQPSPHIMSTWLCVSHGILFYTSEDPLWLILPLDKLWILTMVGKMGQLTFRVGYSWNFLMVIIQIIQWNCGYDPDNIVLEVIWFLAVLFHYSPVIKRGWLGNPQINRDV